MLNNELESDFTHDEENEIFSKSDAKYTNMIYMLQGVAACLTVDNKFHSDYRDKARKFTTYLTHYLKNKENKYKATEIVEYIDRKIGELNDDSFKTLLKTAVSVITKETRDNIKYAKEEDNYSKKQVYLSEELSKMLKNDLKGNNDGKNSLNMLLDYNDEYSSIIRNKYYNFKSILASPTITKHITHTTKQKLHNFIINNSTSFEFYYKNKLEYGKLGKDISDKDVESLIYFLYNIEELKDSISIDELKKHLTMFKKVVDGDKNINKAVRDELESIQNLYNKKLEQEKIITIKFCPPSLKDLGIRGMMYNARRFGGYRIPSAYKVTEKFMSYAIEYMKYSINNNRNKATEIKEKIYNELNELDNLDLGNIKGDSEEDKRIERDAFKYELKSLLEYGVFLNVNEEAVEYDKKQFEVCKKLFDEIETNFKNNGLSNNLRKFSSRYEINSISTVEGLRSAMEYILSDDLTKNYISDKTKQKIQEFIINNSTNLEEYYKAKVRYGKMSPKDKLSKDFFDFTSNITTYDKMYHEKEEGNKLQEFLVTFKQIVKGDNNLHRGVKFQLDKLQTLSDEKKKLSTKYDNIENGFIRQKTVDEPREEVNDSFFESLTAEVTINVVRINPSSFIEITNIVKTKDSLIQNLKEGKLNGFIKDPDMIKQVKEKFNIDIPLQSKEKEPIQRKESFCFDRKRKYELQVKTLSEIKRRKSFTDMIKHQDNNSSRFGLFR